MIDLDTVFRSIINFKVKNKETILQGDLLKNFRAMQQIVPDPPEEKAYRTLYNFILQYVKDCDTGEPELPSYEIIRKHYEEVEGNEGVLAILEKIKIQTPYIGQDYKSILRSYNNDQDTLKLERILNNVNKIATVGLDVGLGKAKATLKGVMDGISYFAMETKGLLRNLTGVKTESQIVSIEDSEEVVAAYKKAEADPEESLGVKTWLKQVDESTGGLKNTELMIIAAYTAHCKTTFAMNMAYRALWGGFNTAFITLEQSFDEIRQHMYCLHASNPKFKTIYPQYTPHVGNVKYNDTRYGRLRGTERDYWFEVCKDFNKNFNEKSEDYGRFFIWQPEKTVTTLSDIELKMRQWQQELQAMGRGDLEMVVLDYITLMGADKDQRTSDANQTLNNIIKSLKRSCLTFNNGKGIRMASPFQVNRAGFKEALEKEGRYYPTALSNAHEAERSADVIISLFKKDELNKNNGLRICCLKNRRSNPFEPFDACINFETGFIWNYPDIVEQSDNIDIRGVLG